MSIQRIDVGHEGSVVLPDGLRKRFGLTEGSFLIAEERAEGICCDRAVDVELYSPERKAEFLLSNATDPREYAEAVAEVRRIGLDPARIDHFR